MMNRKTNRDIQRSIRVIALIALATFCTSGCSGPTGSSALPPMHIFLLAGQSNMAGRGELSEIDRTPHPRVFVLDKNDKWVIATEPLHFDKPKVRGTGPGLAFAKEIAKQNPEIRIGLVPTAVGGSGIETWAPGGYHEKTGLYPWDDAVRRLRVAMQSGELKAILWHQGESDSRPERAPQYEKRLHDLIRRFRNIASDEQLPFIIGQLGQFKEWSDGRQLVNAVHENVPAQIERTRFVSSDGLTDIGDGTHFDARSARELGRRYADAYADILH
ncbi:MAG: sialate O-acetylesterase [Bacteroidetes bacterium]|nr:MAG: sialate O-acetylesterase [Bacteroidota bacterium]